MVDAVCAFVESQFSRRGVQELGKAHASEAGLREQMDDELRRSAFPELQAILAEHATKLRQLIESSNDVRSA